MLFDHPWSTVPGFPGHSAPQKLLQDDFGIDSSITHELRSFVARDLFAIVHEADVCVRPEVLAELAIEHTMKPRGVGHV